MSAIADKTHRKPLQPTRIDWGLAKATYIAHGPDGRAFNRISREFGVSEMTVRKWARRDKWVEAAAEADNKAAARAALLSVGSLEERNLDTIRVANKARRSVLNEDVVLEPADALRVLPRLATLEQLFAGEATGRIEVGDVQAIVQMVFTVAARFVPADARPAFMAEIEQAVGGLTALGEEQAA